MEKNLKQIAQTYQKKREGKPSFQKQQSYITVLKHKWMIFHYFFFFGKN